MRLYGHVGYPAEFPGRALCGKKVQRAKGPALVFCGRCVVALIEDIRRQPRYITWTIPSRDGDRS